MIRFLIVLECFLVALLVSPWFVSAVPDDNPSAQQQLAQQPATHAVAAGEQTSREAKSALMAHNALSATNRVILAKELLGLPDGGSPPADETSSGHDARRPSGIDSASVMSDSAAPTTAERPARTNDSLPAEANGGAEEARRVLSSASVAAAQRHLSRLGYSPGAVDGVFGERTRRALADYRRRTGAADDLLSETLMARLRRDADRAARNSPPGQVASFLPRDERARGWMASIAGGFQRLLGHEFDSKKQPGRIREYCLRNQETWIFDEGRQAFTYCGHWANAH